MADERIEAYEAKKRLPEYIDRVRSGGGRIVIEDYGEPVAALVSTEDLARLEGAAEQRYRSALEEAGLVVTYPDPGKRVPRKRRRIKVEGIPLSEQIVRDRR